MTDEEMTEVCMIERQVIVTWHKPEEKMPNEGDIVVVTVSGGFDNVTYDHAFVLAEWYDDGLGWYFHDEILNQTNRKSITVHAWCDLEPYKG